MPASHEFTATFVSLRAILADLADRLVVKADTPTEYQLVAKRPSPFPQHKGQPMYFASVRLGKAYVSFHLMALYGDAVLTVPPALKKRMQGKTCFNFKKAPDAEQLSQLRQLTEAGYQRCLEKGWV
jgi:hypothetical protein